MAYSPSDPILLIVVYLSLFIIKKERFNYYWIGVFGLLFILGSGLKEIGIVICALVPFIFIIHRKEVPRKFFLILCILLIILAGLYLYIYTIQTADIERNTIHGSKLKFQNIVNTVVGIIQSSLAPFTNLYKVLRTDATWSKPIALLITILPILLFGIIVLTQKGKIFLKDNFKKILLSFLSIIIINSIILAPYILNNYFEPRMMVVTFALGMLFWGYWLAKLLQLISFQKFDLSYLSIGIVLILVGFSVGAPISQDIKDTNYVKNRRGNGG